MNYTPSSAFLGRRVPLSLSRSLAFSSGDETREVERRETKCKSHGFIHIYIYVRIMREAIHTYTCMNDRNGARLVLVGFQKGTGASAHGVSRVAR